MFVGQAHLYRYFGIGSIEMPLFVLPVALMTLGMALFHSLFRGILGIHSFIVKLIIA
jgi:hypothetical protein